MDKLDLDAYITATISDADYHKVVIEEVVKQQEYLNAEEQDKWGQWLNEFPQLFNGMIHTESIWSQMQKPACKTFFHPFGACRYYENIINPLCELGV